MDADGDFVVAWASKGQDPDGSSGIYAQRFNSMGAPVGGEFHVNTNTVNDQTKPSVAMDSFGNFTIVWVTKGQTFSYFNDVKGQVFDSDGNRIGGEFQVNSRRHSGRLRHGSQPLGGHERHPHHRRNVDAGCIADQRHRHE